MALIVFCITCVIFAWAVDEGHDMTALIFGIAALNFGAKIVGAM